MADFLRIPQVAEKLGVSERSVERWARCGTIPAYRFGGAYRIDAAALDAWIRKQRVTEWQASTAGRIVPFGGSAFVSRAESSVSLAEQRLEELRRKSLKRSARKRAG